MLIFFEKVVIKPFDLVIYVREGPLRMQGGITSGVLVLNAFCLLIFQYANAFSLVK